MAMKSFKPTSAGVRWKLVQDFSHLDKKRPEKRLSFFKKSTGGRNSYGRITVRHRGGGVKRLYREIDFRRDKIGVPGRVIAIEYDPNRTSHIALVVYADGEKRYILCPEGLVKGAEVNSGDNADILPGNCLPLSRIPVGTIIHNIEIRPGKGGQLARSAGTSSQLMAREGGYATIKMPSGEFRKILVSCRASIGQMGNIQHENLVIGKAGRNRYLGRRPHVRGVAMNPVDHPHGGGEGKGKGNIPQSPWGQFAKGFKTRHCKRTDSMIVSRRNQKQGAK